MDLMVSRLIDYGELWNDTEALKVLNDRDFRYQFAFVQDSFVSLLLWLAHLLWPTKFREMLSSVAAQETHSEE